MLTVHFRLDSTLQEAFATFREANAPFRALLVTVEDEVMRLHGKMLESSANMDNDLAKVRENITTEKLEAAFIIVKISEGEFALVSFCLDSLKPRVRMLYASGAGHLADVSGLNYILKEHAMRVEEITSSLFAKENSASRTELMTEKEKLYAAIEKMEIAPMQMAMPGVTMPITEEGVNLLKGLSRGDLNALSFAVDTDKIIVDKVLEASEDLLSSLSEFVETVKVLLPEDHPRFVLLRFPSNETANIIMVYVSPSASKPRERMAYASSKSSFVLQAEQHGIIFLRRSEVGSVDELQEVVADTFGMEQKEGSEE
ncbi:G-actin binding protein, putative [Trypanosoma cruzi]|uniref:G-actin binding protein, putative n=1 Tax=Trypanosoma cruzi (strain CL Brener) TaxID=353153 RepID=Q4E5A0_TRYCC|nr:G-actin binding protein, putative [Trypanosoma cruzi]ABF13411.1 putative twinfilin [Trypanosoma cruzi strain CL Brener]EAN99934.1 G-actin binding protein, putative [Trypanosoma cruzi]|eukprot:XP_821785.1 G-actin binding protein [Trypanosoma cruzi strain CL Brener]